MIDWFEALVLGMVQGATEFLPVSSSGHLVIVQNIFGLTEPAVLFDVVLHVATLLAVLWYYRKDVLAILRQSVAALRGLSKGAGWTAVQAEYPFFRLAWLIFVGSIPTAVLGFGFQETFEKLFGSLQAVGMMLMITGLWLPGLVLLLTRFAPRGERGIPRMRVRDAVLIGLAQGLAIAPGISRSGFTLAAALLLGLERETAARYSFLLSVPSVLGALLFKLADGGNGVSQLAMFLGFVAALVAGYFCLVLLVRVVKRGQLAWFAPYCFLVGLLALYFGDRF